MDEATFKERVKKLTEINKVVVKLDPAIRGQAFALLEGYVGTGKISSHKPEDSDRVDAPADPKRDGTEGRRVHVRLEDGSDGHADGDLVRSVGGRESGNAAVACREWSSAVRHHADATTNERRQ